MGKKKCNRRSFTAVKRKTIADGMNRSYTGRAATVDGLQEGAEETAGVERRRLSKN